MCGIAGVLSFDQKSCIKSDIVSSMLEAIKHRGPDGDGLERVHNGVLGHVRLAIRDLSELGHQPMVTESERYVLVYNGELYNTEELKKLLFNKYEWSPKGSSDTEILLKLLEEEGVSAALEVIRGMFAFGLYDNIQEKLYLARDQLGIKPLYYIRKGHSIAFCSEFNGVMKSGLSEKKISVPAVATLLERNYIPSPLTLYEDVYKLKPGYYLEIDASNVTTIKPYQYYSQSYENDDISLQEIEDRMVDSIKEHLISEVEVGCFLSGGVDSSLVASMVRKKINKKLKTFTVSFDQGEYDESAVAERIAEHLGTEHKTFNLDSGYMEKNIHSILDQMDEPFADSSFIPTYIVSKLASEHVKVCLSGDGGDEAFLGYDKYRAYPKVINASQRIGKVPRSALSMLSEHKFLHGLFPFNNSGDKLNKIIEMSKVDTKYRAALILDSFWHLPPINKNYDRFSYDALNEKLDDTVDILNDLDIKYYLPDDLLVKSDIASMKNSLELRVPFLYLDIFNTGVALNKNANLSESKGKLLLRELQKKYLPHDIAEMPKKGFKVPLASWLREGLKDFAKERIDICIERLDFLDKERIYDVFDAHQTGKNDYGYWLWSLVVLGHWLSINE